MSEIINDKHFNIVDGSRTFNPYSFDLNRFELSEDSFYYTFIDRDTGYNFRYFTDTNSFRCYDNSSFCDIYPDGHSVFYFKDGTEIETDDPISIDFINDNYNKNIQFKGRDGNKYTTDNHLITKIEYPDGSVSECFYRSDNTMIKEVTHTASKTEEKYYDINGFLEKKVVNENGILSCYDKDGIERFEDDGNQKVIISKDGYIVMNLDGSFYFGESFSGTYSVDENGNYVLKQKDGTQLVYNDLGVKIQSIDANGAVYTYNYDNYSQARTKNGKTTYSRINHIEYDEEAYKVVLTTLNEISESVPGVLKSPLNEVTNSVQSFPDTYLGNNIIDIDSKINEHINLVSELSERTNYSLLAYQACDKDLEESLYALVDSLFDKSDSVIANSFKMNIRNTIEDSDGDKILEYKSDTNFRIITNSAIVTSTYVDDNGNKWYLNNNNCVVGLEGNNPVIKYGNETFSVLVGESGTIILKDSNGNDLNIFADYNLESIQFGGDQNVFFSYSDGNYQYAGEKPLIDNVINKYFSSASTEEKAYLLFKTGCSSCGYVAMTNLVFKKFQGREQDFYNTFGYPMYDIYKTDDGLKLNYNYEPMILDLACQSCLYETSTFNKQFNITSATINGIGSHTYTQDVICNYLKEQYDVALEGFDKEYIHYGESGYILYNMDGTIYSDVGYNHSMLCVDHTEDGRPIVTSCGEKYILEISTDEEKTEMNQKFYRVYK